MSTSYLALLRRPTVPVAFGATSLARLHYSAVSLALLLAVADRAGSYATAGLAVGGFAAAAVSMPAKARLVDRHGQRRTLPSLDLAYGLALIAVALAPPALVVAAAVVAGLLAPPVEPSMRARWAAATDDVTRPRAFALDTASEEALAVLAPAVAGALAAWSPAGGLLVVRRSGWPVRSGSA